MNKKPHHVGAKLIFAPTLEAKIILYGYLDKR